ncbi:MAG TPA: RES domain-containing protein [Candidatus Paceibacterota bacterium]|jgi:hypothetical protein
MEARELLRQIAEKTIAPEEFLKRLQEISNGSELSLKTYSPNKMSMYRTRSVENGKRVSSAQELSYPPAHACEMQRGNVEGEQVFYASSRVPGTLAESRAEKGEHVILSKWSNIRELRVRQILTDPEVGSTAEIYYHLFTDRDKSIYRYSSLTAHWLRELDPHIGLLYPSLLDDEKDDNLALGKVATDESAGLLHASLYEITEVAPAFRFKVKELDFAVCQNGKLQWKGRPREWPTPGERLRAVFNGWGYDCYDQNGKLVEPI